MKDSCTSAQSAPEQAGNVNIPVAITRTGFQLEWCAPYYGLIDLGVPKQHPDGTKLYAIPEGYCIVPIEPSEISTDAVEAAGRCTACGEELI